MTHSHAYNGTPRALYLGDMPPLAEATFVREPCQGCPCWDECKGERIDECPTADDWYESKRDVREVA